MLVETAVSIAILGVWIGVFSSLASAVSRATYTAQTTDTAISLASSLLETAQSHIPTAGINRQIITENGQSYLLTTQCQAVRGGGNDIAVKVQWTLGGRALSIRLETMV